jgi:hypothetical protein
MTRYRLAGLFWLTLSLSPWLTVSIRSSQDRFSAVSPLNNASRRPANKGPSRAWQDAKGRKPHNDDEEDQKVLKRVRSFEHHANGWFLLAMSVLSWYHVSCCLGSHSTSMTRSTLFLLISSLSNLSCGLVHFMAYDRPSKELEPALLNTCSVRKWYRGLMKFALLHLLLAVYILIFSESTTTITNTVSDDVCRLVLTLLGVIISVRDFMIPTLRHPMSPAKLGYVLLELVGIWRPMVVLFRICLTFMRLCQSTGRHGWAVGVGVMGSVNLLACVSMAMELETIHTIPQSSLTLFARQRVNLLVRIINFWWMLTILANCGLLSGGVANCVLKDLTDFFQTENLVFQQPRMSLLLFWMSLPYFIKHFIALFINKQGVVSLSHHHPSLEANHGDV